MVRVNRASAAFAWLLVAACGSDSDSKAGGGSSSYDAIASAISKPTGTVSESTAPQIAAEYEKILDPSASDASKQNQTIACSGGGDITVVASGSGNSGNVTASYNDCCESSCCLNGGYDYYYAAGAGAAFSYCGSYQVQVDCGSGTESDLQYDGCFGADGEWTYVVRVAGETYAVSGTYIGGSGTLEIRGANGEFTCTYTDGSGSCTGDGEFSF